MNFRMKQLIMKLGFFSNLSQEKSQTATAEIFCHIFCRNNHSEKICLKIFAVGLFCCDKFEETQNKKVSGQSKLHESYFSPLMKELKFLDFQTNLSELKVSCNVKKL